MTNQRLDKPSRRNFLKLMDGGFSSVLVNMHTDWFQQFDTNSGGHIDRVSLHTFNPDIIGISDAVQATVLATTDLSWLKGGDSVFIKVACNSDHAPPAVTSPAILQSVIALLREAGAGSIYVGDMSGALFVRHLADQTIGSTRENMRRNGLLAAAENAGATVHCFEEVTYEQAYIPGIPVGNHHWGTDLYVAEILDRVDHIINLPRLGKHVLAGASLGLKNAIGWISDHSRMVLHRDATTFHEKIAEVNAIPQLAEKTRLTMTLVDHALTTYGPDTGYNLRLEHPLIVASENIVSHDQVALLTLLWARQRTPRSALVGDPYPDQSNSMNWWFVRVTWGSEAAAAYQALPIFADLAAINSRTHINYAYDLLQGGRPDIIQIESDEALLPEDLIAALTLDPELHTQMSDADNRN